MDYGRIKYGVPRIRNDPGVVGETIMRK
jgi:hypothetical protein